MDEESVMTDQDILAFTKCGDLALNSLPLSQVFDIQRLAARAGGRACHKSLIFNDLEDFYF